MFSENIYNFHGADNTGLSDIGTFFDSVESVFIFGRNIKHESVVNKLNEELSSNAGLNMLERTHQTYEQKYSSQQNPQCVPTGV